MIVLLPLRIGTNTPTARVLDQTVANAITRTVEKLTTARPNASLDSSPTPPIIATIRTSR